MWETRRSPVSQIASSFLRRTDISSSTYGSRELYPSLDSAQEQDAAVQGETQPIDQSLLDASSENLSSDTVVKTRIASTGFSNALVGVLATEHPSDNV